MQEDQEDQEEREYQEYRDLVFDETEELDEPRFPWERFFQHLFVVVFFFIEPEEDLEGAHRAHRKRKYNLHDNTPILEKRINVPIRVHHLVLDGNITAEVTSIATREPLLLKGSQESLDALKIEYAWPTLRVKLDDSVNKHVAIHLELTRRIDELTLHDVAAASLLYAGHFLDVHLHDRSLAHLRGYMSGLKAWISGTAALNAGACAVRELTIDIREQGVAEVNVIRHLNLYMHDEAFFHAYGHPVILHQKITGIDTRSILEYGVLPPEKCFVDPILSED